MLYGMRRRWGRSSVVRSVKALWNWLSKSSKGIKRDMLTFLSLRYSKYARERATHMAASTLSASKASRWKDSTPFRLLFHPHPALSSSTKRATSMDRASDRSTSVHQTEKELLASKFSSGLTNVGMAFQALLAQLVGCVEFGTLALPSDITIVQAVLASLLSSALLSVIIGVLATSDALLRLTC